MSATIVIPARETAEYSAARASLATSGYRDIEDTTLASPGQRIRHRGEQFPEAYEQGTGVVLAVMERDPSSWSRSYHRRDIELLVLRDKPLFDGGSRLSQVADYHVATIEDVR